jgi:outer membrane receptor protein involved in Fe transport
MFGSRFLLLFATASVNVAALTGAAFAQARNIDIPAEDLKSALDAYISQSGVELVYKADDVSGLKSQAVHGTFTPEQALDRLLRGTNVTAQRGATGAFVVVRQVKSSAAEAFEGIQTAATETVIVTGSRVIQDAADSPTPLTVMSTAKLRATTPSNLSDALNKLPIFQGSSTQRNAGSASGNSGGDFLNMRAFGQQRTLVLMDGMRVPASNANGSVDISTLPQMLMTRVDVVTGGVSAVYGSDAITGVVNFILDKNFEGVKYEANAGISAYGDGASWQAGVAAGTSLFGGRAHLEGSLQYYHSDGILKKSRPGGAANWSSYGLGTAASPITNIQQGRLNPESFGGRISCTNCSVNGQQFVADDVIGAFDPGIVPVAGGSVSIGGDGVYVHNTHAIAATRHAESFARFSYNLDGATAFWIQSSATEANVFNYFFPSQIDNGRLTNKYFKNNPFLSATDQALLGNNGLYDSSNIFNMQKWLDNQPGRATNSVTRNLILSMGVNGSLFGGYVWEMYYTHGESRDSVTGINNGNNQYHDAQADVVVDTDGRLKCWNNTAAAIALYGDLYPGCVPLNAFGPTAITDAAYHYWSRNTNFAMTNIMDDVAADVSGEIFGLPAGPIRAALSGEMRWLTYDDSSTAAPPAVVVCTGLRLWGRPPTTRQTLWDNNTLASVTAGQNVWEFSAEASIPLLKDIPFIQSFAADIAGRYTDYSVSGAVQTWKLGLNWHINDDFYVRGTTSIDIRAPTLNDLYQPLSSTSIGYFDLLTNYAGTGTQQVTQGNAGLVPEVARTYTAGLVFTPAWLEGFTASVDFYNINLRNAIGSVAGTNTQVQTLCNNSNGASPFCALYQRPIPFGQPGYNTPANYPTTIYSRNLNSAFSATEGEDYELDYRFNLADLVAAWPGAVSLRAMLNVAPKIDSNTFPGSQITHTTSPKGHATVFADYTIGDWGFNGQFHWFSGLWKNGLLGSAAIIYAVPRVPSFNTVDINISRQVTLDNGSSMQAYFSVQNIANATPPIVTGSSGNPGAGIPTPAGEDIMGRYFTLGVRGNL